MFVCDNEVLIFALHDVAVNYLNVLASFDKFSGNQLKMSIP